jgi:hypothetical protein
MSMRSKKVPVVRGGFAPFTIEQLEVGLRVLGEHDIDLGTFWDENIETFRQTVIFAIRETSEALTSPKIPLHWRIELESQLEDLVRYIEFADRYIARRSVKSRPRVLAFPEGRRIH